MSVQKLRNEVFRLNRNLVENKDKEELILHRYNSIGETIEKNHYKFLLGTEKYYRFVHNKELIDVFRIYRFKPELFHVEKLTIDLEIQNFVFGYDVVENKKAKTLFEQFKIEEKTEKFQSAKMAYHQYLANCNQLAELMPKIHQKPVSKEYFNNLLEKFVNYTFIGSFKEYGEEQMRGFHKNFKTY